MIVPSMTFEEMRKEIEKDFEILYRKAKYVVRKVEHDNSPLGKKRIIKFFDYYSKHKNNWIYKADISKKYNIVSFMIYFYGDRGLNAFEKLNGEECVCYFTAHFFRRFNERCKLNLSVPNDIIRAFMADNEFFCFRTIEKITQDYSKMVCSSKSGVSLGILDHKLKIYRMNTFLSNDMLKGSQIEMDNSMKETLEKYLIDKGRPNG
jgi:hypothetical protein